MGVNGQRDAPAALSPTKRAGTPCTGNWVCPKAGLVGKITPIPGLDTRTVWHIQFPNFSQRIFLS